MQTNNFPVDAVFLWVDGSDPSWLAKKKALHRQIFGETKDNEATQQARFRDNGELRYALRSLEQYAPWINRVHIITDDQTPTWINTSKVNIVSHRDIFPPEALLPVFNTRPIAFCAHHIPGLAEHFILFEDDFMLGRRVMPQDFFTKDGKPIARLAKRSKKRIEFMLNKDHKTSHEAVIANSHRIIKNHFGAAYPGTTRHYPKAMTTSTANEIWSTFSDIVSKTLKSPFRSYNDGDLTSLYPLYLIASKKGELKTINGFGQLFDFIKQGVFHIGGTLGDGNASYKMKLIRLIKPKTFCINDSPKAKHEDIKKLQQFLHALFPNPSSYEIIKELRFRDYSR
jgi:hypothetical protein